MRGWLGLFVFVAACGGASQSDVFGDPTPATPGPGTDPSTTPAPTPTATGTDQPKPPDPKPCATTTYFRDIDDDGFGGSATQSACTPPGAGWVTRGGDCADDNKNVFPGQTEYFGASYNRPLGGRSFDYDCSTKEDQKPPLRKAATTCAFVVSACTGDGYVPVVRGGAGVDPLCGATQFQTCAVKAGGPPQTCVSTITSVDPVLCR